MRLYGIITLQKVRLYGMITLEIMYQNTILLSATWIMPQPSNYLNFLSFQPWKYLKSCLVFFTVRRSSTSFKVKHLQYYIEGVYLQYLLLKITFLLYLELKICDYGGSGNSVLISIPLLILQYCNAIWNITFNITYNLLDRRFAGVKLKWIQS